MAGFLIFKREPNGSGFDNPYIEQIDLPNAELTLAVGSGGIYNWKIPIKLIGSIEGKIPYEKIAFDYPRNAWLRYGNIYFPEIDTNIHSPEAWYLNGGTTIPTRQGFIISQKTTASKKGLSELINTLKELLGINAFIFPSVGTYEDIDTKVNFIPWANILVIDRYYRKENKDAIRDALGYFEVIESQEQMAPNFVVYEPTKTIVTYAAPKLAKKLRAKCIDVIEAENAVSSDTTKDAGAHCVTNTYHDNGILEHLLKIEWIFDASQF